jgi:hypothetical protein
MELWNKAEPQMLIFFVDSIVTTAPVHLATQVAGCRRVPVPKGIAFSLLRYVL